MYMRTTCVYNKNYRDLGLCRRIAKTKTDIEKKKKKTLLFVEIGSYGYMK